MTRSARTCAIVALAALVAFPGCNQAEVDKLNADLASAKQEAARMKTELDAASADRARVDREVLAANSAREQSLTDLVAARKALADANDEVTRNAQRIAELEAVEAEARSKLEKAEKHCKDIKSHREELVEWVETTLLPIAEANDPTLASLKRDAEEMTAAVERIRGIPFKRPFMRRLVKREDVGRTMKRDLERDLPREEAERIVHVMAEFGVVDPDTNLYDIFSNFLEAGAAAYYKPNTETFYLIEGQDGPGARPIVFHELVHAVEDQHYELDEMMRKVEDWADRGLAIKGLVEGSADFFQERYHEEHPEEVAAMMQAQMKMAGKQLKMIQTVPTFLIAMMGFYPYKNGSAWLRGIGASTAEDMHKLFTDPPESTEQVLHPEKFPLSGEGRDYPHRIARVDPATILGEGWEEIEDSDMGELLIGLMMVHIRYPGQKNAMARLMNIADLTQGSVAFKEPQGPAIAGWDGDRYTAMFNRETRDVCVVWTSVWDTDTDQQEFADEFARHLSQKVTGNYSSSAAAPTQYVDPDGQVSGVMLGTNRRVVVLLGAPREKVDALFALGLEAEVTADHRDAGDR